LEIFPRFLFGDKFYSLLVHTPENISFKFDTVTSPQNYFLKEQDIYLFVPPAAGRMPSSATLSDLSRRKRREQIVRAEIPLRGTPPLGWRERKV